MRDCFFFVCVLSLAIAKASFAYDTIEVRNGGTVEGVVEYTGATTPQDPMLALSSETEYCGKSIPAGKYLIKDNKIQNVIVYLENVKAGKSVSREPVTVTNKKCQFIPRVAVGFRENQLVLKNDDPVLHTFDIHTSLKGKELFHVALHEKGSSVAKTILERGLLELSCYVHPWQHAYVYIFDHPYAAVTDEKGAFVLNDVPPGTYVLKAWHEALGTKTISDITVESGKTSTIKLEYHQ